MESWMEIVRHPEDVYPLLKLKMAVRRAEKQIPPDPHLAFCHSILPKVSRTFALLLQQLGPDVRDAACVFYMVLRALDTIEDDMNIATDVKVPILEAFHQYIHDKDWHFSCGTNHEKVLMDQLQHVFAAFSELDKSYQEIIEDITKRMGAGMAKFICKEMETTEDYDEYCHYVAGLYTIGMSKLSHASKLEDVASDTLSNSMGVFSQKIHIIKDYFGDINEIPKIHMFWPRQIWGKYANKLEDFKYEENSERAVQCLNEMITNALYHAEDCLTYMSALRDPAIFRLWAISKIIDIGTLAMFYNNVEVFRRVVRVRRGLAARVVEQTKSMDDVYGAFYDFSYMMRSKVDNNDPNATLTLNRLDAIQKTCRDSGLLNKRKSFIVKSRPNYNPVMMTGLARHIGAPLRLALV